MAYAQIIVKLYRREQDRIYTYEIPQGMCLSVGMMVQVPFGGGNRLIEGLYWKLRRRRRTHRKRSNR